MKRALLALALVLASSHALADDEAAATNLFNAGRDLMKSGDYGAACPKLQESVRLKPTVGALAKLAACEEHEQRLASAYGRWQQALNLARATNDPRAADVEAEFARIDHVVPKLVVTAEGVPADDLVVHVDALEFRVAGLGVPLPVEPGHHAIRATATKKVEWTSAIDTAPDGATSTVKVPPLQDALEPVAPPPPIAPPPPAVPIVAPPVERHASMPSLRVAALVTGGVGVAGVVLGGVFGALAISGKSAAGCDGTVCPDSASQATLESAKGRADVSTIALIAGGVLVASGVTMWLLAPSPRAPSVAVRVGPGVLSGAW